MKPIFTRIDINELRERVGDWAEDWITAVEQRQKLYDALKEIKRQIEIGALVRETVCCDDDPAWGMRQIPLGQALYRCQVALEDTEAGR